MAAVQDARGERRRKAAVEALVSAGTLEAALADDTHPAAQVVASCTDQLAADALGLRPSASPRDLGALEVPDVVAISPPEGFSYYALHPESYARATEAVDAARVLVVGVRSIGTTLSAVATQALRGRGADAVRLTVRPDGPPHDRRLAPSPSERAAIDRARREGATVLVVDEGPGQSGSTFLAVGDALVAAGIERERVLFVCSHEPDLDALVAPGGPARFRAFRRLVAPADVRVPCGTEISAGAWRALVFGDRAAWPASWLSTERRKWLRCGRIFKYEGIGRSGAEVRARLFALESAGFAPDVREEGDGLVSSTWLAARPLAAIDADVIGHLARYCALRPSLCPAARAPEDLVPVAQKNLEAAFGRPVEHLELHVERPAICDARMMPHEWARTAAGAIVKLDAASHGDDHFFPGPTDIAWDLAGAIIEWGMDRAAAGALLEGYRRASGDDARARIDGWLAAYVALRAGWLLAARAALRGAPEVARIEAALARHRDVGLVWVRGLS